MDEIELMLVSTAFRIDKAIAIPVIRTVLNSNTGRDSRNLSRILIC